jgi:hypothetical protein
MTDYDPTVAAALDRLVPPLSCEPTGWHELLREGGVRSPKGFRQRFLGIKAPRRNRIFVVTAALIATVSVAIPALAVSKGWWFLGTGQPKPQSDVATVTAGRAAGIDWNLTAYLSRGKGVCVALTPDVGKGDMGAMSCGSEVRGEPVLSSSDTSEAHWVGTTYFSLGMHGFPDFVFGPIAEGVDRVDAILENGQVIRTDALKGPDSLRVPVDFYALSFPRGASVRSVIARDRSGHVLEERECFRCGVGSFSSKSRAPRDKP